MLPHFYVFSLAISAIPSVLGSPLIVSPRDTTAASTDDSATATSPAKQLYSFSPRIFLENEFARPNGQVLLSSIQEPTVYTFSKLKTGNTARPLATIKQSTPAGDINGCFALAPQTPSADAYAVLGVNLDLSTFTIRYPGLYTFDASKATSNGAAIEPKLAANLTGIVHSPNGMVLLPNHDNVFLVADSNPGAVYRVDATTGKTVLAVSDPEMAASSSANPPIGINGLAVFDGFLYWTNTDRHTFSRVKINSDGTRASGARTETLARTPSSQGSNATFDDLAFDKDGNAYIAVHPSAVLKVETRNKNAQSVLSGGSSALGVPTSVRFPRDGFDTLYITTGTGQVSEIKL